MLIISSLWYFDTLNCEVENMLCFTLRGTFNTHLVEFMRYKIKFRNLVKYDVFKGWEERLLFKASDFKELTCFNVYKRILDIFFVLTTVSMALMFIKEFKVWQVTQVFYENIILIVLSSRTISIVIYNSHICEFIPILSFCAMLLTYEPIN